MTDDYNLSDAIHDSVAEQWQQDARAKRLKEMHETQHRSHYGDYDDYFETFWDEYLSFHFGEQHEGEGEYAGAIKLIPKYAAIRGDETYSMIHVYDNIVDALSDQATAQDNGDTLNVPDGIIDLDTGEPIETRSVTMTAKTYGVLVELLKIFGGKGTPEGQEIFAIFGIEKG